MKILSEMKTSKTYGGDSEGKQWNLEDTGTPKIITLNFKLRKRE